MKKQNKLRLNPEELTLQETSCKATVLLKDLGTCVKNAVKWGCCPGLNLCRNKPDLDPAPPKSDPAPHFGGSPSSRANKRRSCSWPIACIYWKIFYNDPHIYIWNNKLKRAKDATCKRLLTASLTRPNARIHVTCVFFLNCFHLGTYCAKEDTRQDGHLDVILCSLYLVA